MFEDRSIPIFTYILETVLAEKLQTVLARSVDNTRMKDFYDIHMLISLKSDKIDVKDLNAAFYNTANKRDTQINIQAFWETVERLKQSSQMNNLWENYKSKSFYVDDISWGETMKSVSQLCSIAFSQDNPNLSSNNRNSVNSSEVLRAYEERKALRAANPPKTLSQKIEDATKRSREKKAAAPPRPKPTDHKPKR